MANGIPSSGGVTDPGRLTPGWADVSIKARLRVIRRLRHLIASRPGKLYGEIQRPSEETLVSEILPLLEACRFLEQRAEAILAPRREESGRPLWLAGTTLEIRREPLGRVLIVGPSNYPLLLVAVQTLQALAAGNSVVVKPGRAAGPVLSAFVEMLFEAGLPRNVCRLLDENPLSAEAAIQAGVDKVVLTGSSATGAKVLSLLAPSATPSVMELSGLDACIVLEGADIELAAQAIRFGSSFNGGNTCIAPRRLFAHQSLAGALSKLLPADRRVSSFSRVSEAVAAANASDFALGATIFGPAAQARNVASQLYCGVVVINDMIVPTADPRVPFGGRAHSGFGVTRGAEGLLEMTAVKAVCIRRGRSRPHLQPRRRNDAELFEAYIGAAHSRSLASRARHLVKFVRAAMKRNH
ncbi:MAG TPA: aldehyde dehydrogenase family protein [Bryobacteraceae bacterium]|nr:aldehyde dehydrogenase family protein [Bryobacteraceae bacterium]